MLIPILMLVILLAMFLIICFMPHHDPKPLAAPGWVPPSELNNDDKAWLNSQLELAGAGHLQLEIRVSPELGERINAAASRSGSMWGGKFVGKRTHQGNNRGPYKNGYQPRPQAEIDKAVYHLRKLEESRRSNYDPATDSYYIGSRKISRQMYEDMVQ